MLLSSYILTLEWHFCIHTSTGRECLSFLDQVAGILYRPFLSPTVNIFFFNTNSKMDCFWWLRILLSAQLMWSEGYRLVRWLLSASSNDEKFEKLFFVLFLIVTRHIMSSFFSFTLFHFNFSFEAKIKKKHSSDLGTSRKKGSTLVEYCTFLHLFLIKWDWNKFIHWFS